MSIPYKLAWMETPQAYLAYRHPSIWFWYYDRNWM